MEQIYWCHEPRWDAQNKGWYWEGQRLEGTLLKHVRSWLRPDEFGPDGHPLPNAMPPTSPTSYQQPPVSASQPGDFNAPASSLTQQSLAYAPLTGLSSSPGLSSQGFSKYHSYDSNLTRDPDEPCSTKESRRYHKKHSDRRSSFPQVPSTHLDSFLQQASFQNTESNDVPSLGPVATANGVGGGSQGQPVIPSSPGAGPWAGGPNFATSQVSPVQGSLSFPLNSTTGTNTAPTIYHYGAQVHQGAKWAGGPSHGDVGLAPIQVKHNALDKIKHVSIGGGNIFLDPNFVVHPSSSFQPGKIIKVWWSEPLGMPTRGAFGSRLSTPDTLLKDHQKAIWSGFRRFIIIRNFEGHCHGIPIYTYGGKGCMKHGVKHYEHGVIYEDSPGNTGTLLPNEKPLGCPSIRARTTNGEPMDNASRVNYAKVADIGHNLKVNFVAEVTPEDWNVAKNALRKFGFC